MNDKKETIIKELETMAKKVAIEREFFKVRAYNKVINQIILLKKVKSMDDLVDIEGIGGRIREKLVEIFKTGKLKAAEKARKDPVIKIIDIFLSIHGIGMVKAKELVEKFKITSIKELEEKLEINPKILNSKQKIGLEYHLDTQQRIPKKEMDLHSRKIKKLTKDNIDRDLQIDIVGSYRRGTLDSGDIDILLTINRKVTQDKRTKILKKFISILTEADYILADLVNGSKKYMGICKLKNGAIARRIDILITSQEEYPFALLYFTGDFQVNIVMRKKAIELGYTLNEYSLKGSPKILLTTEKEIFNFLGFKYLKPSERNAQNLQEI
jgi:DNA polymerase IV